MHASPVTKLKSGLIPCLLLFIAGAAFAQIPAKAKGKSQDWPYYGGPGQTRYSPLKQITRENVNQLQLAWTFDTNESSSSASETQPIMVNGIFYGITPSHKLIALNAATGKQLWKFDSGIEGRGPNRGLTYWTDGKEERVFIGNGTYLYAIDARSGKAAASFGNAGRIDLREGLGREPEKLSLGLSTPGVVYRELLMIGGPMAGNAGISPGEIRRLY